MFFFSCFFFGLWLDYIKLYQITSDYIRLLDYIRLHQITNINQIRLHQIRNIKLHHITNISDYIRYGSNWLTIIQIRAENNLNRLKYFNKQISSEFNLKNRWDMKWNLIWRFRSDQKIINNQIRSDYCIKNNWD